MPGVRRTHGKKMSSKSEILALLKRNGGHSVGALARTLDLSPVTVRRHLTGLEREGLVIAQAAPPGAHGRMVFRLTAKAHVAAFPRRSDRLVELLVREVGDLDGAELQTKTPSQRMQLVLNRLAHRLAAEYAPLLQGWALAERVGFVTEVMHADGGFAEWERTPVGYEIRDFNCLFRRLLDGNGTMGVCEWHARFLSEALGAQVRVSPCPESAGNCCQFVIRELSPGGSTR
jgi:predicted ArsR family transcriptional regulator